MPSCCILHPTSAGTSITHIVTLLNSSVHQAFSVQVGTIYTGRCQYLFLIPFQMLPSEVSIGMALYCVSSPSLRGGALGDSRGWGEYSRVVYPCPSGAGQYANAGHPSPPWTRLASSSLTTSPCTMLKKMLSGQRPLKKE